MTTMFRFKHFTIQQDRCAMKVGTDGILLGAWATANAPTRILDIGAGTGLIALMLAQRFPLAIVDGVELEESAIEQARENFRVSPWAWRLNAIAGCIRDVSLAQSMSQQYSLIVSNPPWFSDSLKSGEPARDLARHMDVLNSEDLPEMVLRLLTQGGRFATILPTAEGLRLIEHASAAGLQCCRRCDVYPKAAKPSKRLLLEFVRDEAHHPLVSESLVVEADQRHDYTQEFRDLTKEFYLRF
jgi:tRNA1Val (adenine37-N6)-methyltransferase